MEHFYHRKYSFRPILVVRILSQQEVSWVWETICCRSSYIDDDNCNFVLPSFETFEGKNRRLSRLMYKYGGAFDLVNELA